MKSRKFEPPHHTVLDNSEVMFGRRGNGRSLLPTLFVVSIILIGGYGYYMYRELSGKYAETETKLASYMKRQVSLKSQLHGK